MKSSKKGNSITKKRNKSWNRWMVFSIVTAFMQSFMLYAAVLIWRGIWDAPTWFAMVFIVMAIGCFAGAIIAGYNALPEPKSDDTVNLVNDMAIDVDGLDKTTRFMRDGLSSKARSPLVNVSWTENKEVMNQEIYSLPAVIGRVGSECQIVVHDKSVSQVHAKIFREGGYYFLQDLNSANGTFLDNQRITDRTIVYTWNEVKIGSVIMRFDILA